MLLSHSLVCFYIKKTKKKAMATVVAFFGALQPKKEEGDGSCPLWCTIITRKQKRR
jgi:hypothetical protein